MAKAEVVKADDGEDDSANEAAKIADGLDLTFLESLPADLLPLYKKMAQASARQALKQVAGVAQVKGDLDTLLSQADSKAITWAQDKAAAMVGKKLVDGVLVDNPDSKWIITDTTRAMLKEKIGAALKEGWSKDKLAKAVTGDVIGKSRARMIAQTELAFTHSAGNRIGWQGSTRVKGRYSILSSDHDVPDVCDDNAAAGVIPLGDAYPSGDDGYPFHPRCECAEVAVLDDEALEEAA